MYYFASARLAMIRGLGTRRQLPPHRALRPGQGAVAGDGFFAGSVVGSSVGSAVGSVLGSVLASTFACLLAFPSALLVVGLAAGSARAATIRIVNVDRAGEGLNDTTPATPVGGNGGETIGAQRRNAIRRAAAIWANRLDSPVEIVLEVGFNPLGCDAESAVLGQASPSSVHSEFAGAPDPELFYVSALANRLAGIDLCPAESCRNSEDIRATFSSSFGVTCEFGGSWYYGFDADPPPRGADLVTVAMHELGHGLGFVSLARLRSGAFFGRGTDAFTAQLEDHRFGDITDLTPQQRVAAFVSGDQLHLVGEAAVAAGGQLDAGVGDRGHIVVYAPSPLELGSSVSHLDRSLSPNQLMEPVLRFATHEPGVAGAVLRDMGWSVSDGTCAGDCNGDFEVVTSELVLAVRVALSAAPLSECRRADRDQNGRVGIGDLVRGVGSALHGCGGTVIESSEFLNAVDVVARSVGEPASGCEGDCDGDGRVSVQELVRGVNIALGRAEVGTCAALDRDMDGRVAVNELIVAVSRALEGCNCRFDFLDERAGADQACVFTGTWSEQCGDDGLPATFGVANGVVGVAIVTGDGSPTLTFFAQPTGPRDAAMLGYMFGGEVVQLGGTLSLSDDGAHLALDPAPRPDVVIDDCAFDRYRGVFARTVETAGAPSSEMLVMRALRAAGDRTARFAEISSQ